MYKVFRGDFMYLSILAGILISLGCLVYLSVGGVAGALLFSVGLLSVLYFKANLFTGKVGLLVSNQITPIEVGKIYLGNLIGCLFVAGLVLFVPGLPILEGAAAITSVRIANLWYVNIIYGIVCGMFMYAAVNVHKLTPIATMMCVAAFILSGTNHCVADMFYFAASLGSVPLLGGVSALICTTLGNVIGANVIGALVCGGPPAAKT